MSKKKEFSVFVMIFVLGMLAIKAHDHLYSLQEIEEFAYDALLYQLDKSPDDVKFKSMLKTAIIDGEISRRENAEIIKYVIGMQRVYTSSRIDKLNKNAKSILQMQFN